MIKAVCTDGSVLVGLSELNMKRLLEGRAIEIDLASMGLAPLNVCIVGGKTEQAIVVVEQLRRSGLMDGAVPIHAMAEDPQGRREALMPVQTLRGEPDENCLHCTLPQVISEFIQKHPEYRKGIQTIVDLAMVTGEIIGSGIVNSGRRDALDEVLAIAAKEMRRSALELLEAMDRKRS